MIFTWDEIDQDWLQGNQLATPNDEVVAAFNRVADQFGRDWTEASRVHDGVVTRGTSPTLSVVTLGQLLASLGSPPKADHLLEKIRKRSSDAKAELNAIYLVCSDAAGVELELEPEVTVGKRDRLADFRVRREDEDWVYVEVTQPGTSDAQADVRRGLKQLAGLAATCTGSFALEVFLLREPTSGEVEAISADIMERHPIVSSEQTSLPNGLGVLYWNSTQPGEVTAEDHDVPYTPRLGMAMAAVQNGDHRHISVRWPFTDQRAAKFVSHEAEQLPTHAPGLIMIQTSNATGAMRAWQPLIERRFQPNINTRISAVCLFAPGQRVTPNGAAWTVDKADPQPTRAVSPAELGF